MNKYLRNTLEANTPKFNKRTMEGVAREMIGGIVNFLNNVIISATRTLGDNIDLEYKGYRFLTPEEDFKNNINTAYSKNEIDITKSFLYKVEFMFRYKNTEINKVISLPYVTRGGFIKMSNASYIINPVLSEYPVAPAPSKGEVFIRLLRDKLNVKRMERPLFINGRREVRPIIYANTFKLQKRDTNVNQNVPFVIYMLIKHGFYGAFKKYFNTEPIVKVSDETDENLIAKGYVEYTTAGQKPRNYKGGPNYIPHNLKIYIKEKDINSTLDMFVASIIYMFDLSPNYAYGITKAIGKKKESSTYFDILSMDDETRYWVILLGHVIFGPNRFGLTRVLDDMTEHINILNGYLDDIIKEKLAEKDIIVEDFYELLFWTMDNYNNMVMNYERYSSDINNRYVEILYYILFDFIVSINKAFLEIKRTHAKGKLSEKECNRIFTSYVTPKKIFNLIKAGSTNIAIMPITDYSGDNLYWKMTSILEDQNRGDGVKRSGKKNTLPQNTRILRAEDLIFGSILNLKKKYPSPRFSLNPFVGLDVKTGKFILDANDKAFMKELEAKLSKKFEDANIADAVLESDDTIGL